MTITKFPESFSPAGRQSWQVKSKAFKEFLTGMYIISSENREEAFSSKQKFLESFFTCRTEIPADYFSDDLYRLEARISADTIRRPQPLSLLDPFFTSELTVTGWTRLGN